MVAVTLERNTIKIAMTNPRRVIKFDNLGLRGSSGYSAYELWIRQPGNAGKTEAQFFDWIANSQIDAVQPYLTAAQAARDAAQGHATTANTKAQEASASQLAAENSAVASNASAIAALQKADEADASAVAALNQAVLAGQAADTALAARIAAQVAEATANQKALDAELSRVASVAAQAIATDKATEAENARALAVAAKDTAVTKATEATNSATASETSRVASVTAKTASEAARDLAMQYRDQAQAVAGGNFQPNDPTLTAVSSQTWTTGKQLFAMTAQDVFARLNVGNVNSSDILDRDAGDARYIQPTRLDPRFGEGVVAGGLVNLRLANPGVGGTQRITFERSSDTAGLEITETVGDSVDYSFYMTDNPDGGDNFNWRFGDHQSANGLWHPLKIGGMSSRYLARSHDFFGNISQKLARFYTCADASMRQTIDDPSRLRVAGTSALAISSLNVGAYSGTSGTHMFIETTSSTQFRWGYGKYNGAGVTYQQQGLNIASSVTLSNDVTINFSNVASATTGDVFTCRVWREPSNVFGASSFTGSVSFSQRPSFNGNTPWDNGNFNPSTKADTTAVTTLETTLRAEIATAISNLVNGAPDALNTLAEIATRLQSSEGNYTNLVSQVAAKLNLDFSNIADVSAARVALGLGALAILSQIATTHIADDAVTYSKMQNVSATARLLGRISAEAGNVEELTAAQVKTLLSLVIADIPGLQAALDNAGSVQTVNNIAPDVNGNIQIVTGGGAFGLAGVTDWVLETLLTNATSAAVQKPWGFADPLASSSLLDLTTSAGETFSTGYVDNFTTPSLSVESTPTGTISQAFTSAVCLLPSGTEMADDVGIVMFYIRPVTGTTPIALTNVSWRGAAMTQVGLQTSSSGARLYVYSYKITGSESGNASIQAAWPSTDARCAINVYRVRGANPTVKVAFATSNNPPQLTGMPSGKTNLFIAAVAGSSGTASDAGAPGSYTDVVNTANFSGQQAIVSARRFVAQSSEDPGTFTNSPSGTNLILACTIGVEVGVGVTSEMSLVWNVFTTPVVPTAAAVWVEVEAVSGTITPNTNLMVDVSRDGGGTYSTAVLKARGSPVSGVQTYVDWSLSLASQSSNNNCRVRVRTDDDAGIRIHKIGVLTG